MELDQLAPLDVEVRLEVGLPRLPAQDLLLRAAPVRTLLFPCAVAGIRVLTVGLRTVWRSTRASRPRSRLTPPATSPVMGLVQSDAAVGSRAEPRGVYGKRT